MVGDSGVKTLVYHTCSLS